MQTFKDIYLAVYLIVLGVCVFSNSPWLWVLGAYLALIGLVAWAAVWSHGSEPPKGNKMDPPKDGDPPAIA